MIQKLILLIASLILVACAETNNEEASSLPPAQPEQSTQNGQYVLDTHYKHVNEVINSDSDSKTVTAFFWYGCPHCEAFNPYLTKWESSIPENVKLVHAPVVWNKSTALHAKLFFIASQMDNFDELHQRLFTETIAVKNEMDLEAQTTHFSQIFEEFGLNKNEFMSKISSKNLDDQLEDAFNLMKASGLEGTPAITVNGKYLVINGSVGSYSGVMDIADYLIDKSH